MKPDLDVVVVCEINVDVVVTGVGVDIDFGTERTVDDVRLTAGSSGVLVASGLAALGMHVGVCGMVGDDLFGRFMLDHLDRLRIDRRGVLIDPEQLTGASVLLSNARDRAILTMPGAMAEFSLEHVAQELLGRARHVHLSSYFLQAALRPDVPELLLRARRAGATTSADTGHDPRERWEIGGLLEGLDVFLPNESEACAISGQTDVHDALDGLAPRVPTVAVKRGANGALAAQRGTRVDLPGFSVRSVDTTGAGDAFDAGFLSGLLAGEDLLNCVRRGNACGALTAAHVGGFGGYDAARVQDLLHGREC